MAVVLLVVFTAGCARSESLEVPASPARSAPVARPSVVMVIVDDLDLKSYMDRDRFPVFHNEMIERGATFSNFFVTDSLCCPSRVSILRGQYGHNTKILSNVPPAGGFEKFRASGLEQSTLATWLRDAGYRTGLVGKYLNGYPEDGQASYIPPGWDFWVSPVAGDAYTQYDYALNDNGTYISRGSEEADYLGDVINADAIRFLRTTPADQPAFLYVAPFVPHAPAEPPVRYADAFPDARLPRTASFDQADLSAEPRWFRNRRKLLASEIRNLEVSYRLRLQSMLTIEDLLRDLLDTLASTGRLESTYVILTSDNGFHLGQHRLRAGKETAYDEDVRVPFVIRGPDIDGGTQVNEMTSAVDIAPTIAELTGTEAPAFVDGASFAGLLVGLSAGPEQRQSVLIEHLSRNADPDTGVDPPFDPDEPIRPTSEMRGASPSMTPQRRLFISPPTYSAIRTKRYLFVDYLTGERQLYDMRRDPDQLDNIAATAPRALIRELEGKLRALTSCRAASCRAASERN